MRGRLRVCFFGSGGQVQGFAHWITGVRGRDYFLSNWGDWGDAYPRMRQDTLLMTLSPGFFVFPRRPYDQRGHC